MSYFEDDRDGYEIEQMAYVLASRYKAGQQWKCNTWLQLGYSYYDRPGLRVRRFFLRLFRKPWLTREEWNETIEGEARRQWPDYVDSAIKKLKEV